MPPDFKVPTEPSDRLLKLEQTEVSPVAHAHSLLRRQMPGLDILRGVAVLSVFCYHGLFWYQPTYYHGLTSDARRVAAPFIFGWLGVNLFFILSGFLITGILIDTRERKNYWRSFYVRRVLRIMPLYLVTIAVVFAIYDLHPFYLLLCLLYAANMTFYFANVSDYSPFWSLAVEEQFYLVWPLLAYHLRKRTLGWLCVSLIVISPLLRALSVNRFRWLGSASTTTWLVLDNLAWGALVAILLRSTLASEVHVRKATNVLLFASAALAALLAALHQTSRATPLGAALQIEPFLFLFTALLLLALRLGSNPRLLRWTTPLRFLGYISYGLYLLHVVFFWMYDYLYFRWLSPTSPVVTLPSLLTRFGVVAVLGCGLCYLSRRYFEDRFLQLKEKLVPYNKEPAQPAGYATNTEIPAVPE